jgi:hypothetical protein
MAAVNVCSIENPRYSIASLLNEALTDGNFLTLSHARIVRVDCHFESGLQGTLPWSHSRGVMKRSAHDVPASHWVGALLTLLAAGLLLPSSARAGCINPHVTSRSHGPHGISDLIPLGRSGGMSIPMGDMPLDRPAPCSGALCSGNPAVPISTIPPVSPRFGDEWAISILAIVSPGPGTFVGKSRGGRLHSVDDPTSVFHPPRAAAPSITH